MMKRLLAICAAVALIMAVGSTAHATQISSAPGYAPSTDISFGDSPNVPGRGSPGPTGYQLSDEFQFNLLYGQTAGTDANVDAFNDWDGSGVNWHDPEEYILTLALGGAELFVYDGDLNNNDKETFFDWTITGWTNTILAGNLVDQDESGSFSDGDFLQLVGGYRTFPGNANAIEVWGGQSLATEVAGYTLNLTGGVLEVDIAPIPEPTTMLLLSSGLIGLVGFRRKFKKN